MWTWPKGFCAQVKDHSLQINSLHLAASLKPGRIISAHEIAWVVMASFPFRSHSDYLCYIFPCSILGFQSQLKMITELPNSHHVESHLGDQKLMQLRKFLSPLWLTRFWAQFDLQRGVVTLKEGQGSRSVDQMQNWWVGKQRHAAMICRQTSLHRDLQRMPNMWPSLLSL